MSMGVQGRPTSRIAISDRHELRNGYTSLPRPRRVLGQGCHPEMCLCHTTSLTFNPTPILVGKPYD